MLVTVEGVGGVWTPELARATFAFGGDGATVPEAFDATGSVTLGGAAFAGTESDGAKMGGMCQSQDQRENHPKSLSTLVGR